MNAQPSSTLSPEAREQAGGILNQALADEFALSTATRDYHWNVTGPRFRSLGELFAEQHRQIEEWIEKLGERARSLGATARTSWSDLIDAPRFVPARGADLSADGMMARLIELHDRMAERLRADARICAAGGDAAPAAELLAALVEYHETTAWMLGELLDDRQRALA